MKFTANRCATEGIEETFDRYESIIDKDPLIWMTNRRVKDMIGCIRDALINGKAPLRCSVCSMNWMTNTSIWTPKS